MLRIGICEDEEAVREHLHSMLVKVLFAHTDIEIQNFTDGDEVIEEIKHKNFFVELLFLDIHMKRVDGIKTAEFIRRHGIDVDIIFLSKSGKYVFEGYTYKAFAYYLKPVSEKMLTRDLLRYLKERRELPECLNISTKSEEIYIPLNKIIYFKSEKRRITAYTLTGEMIFYKRLDELEELVKDKGFMRCHQSYMVNRNMIDAIGRKEIIVQGIPVPVSRKYYEKMEQCEDETACIRITHSLALNQKRAGAIVFIKGKLLGAIIRIQSDKEIMVGRDAAKADIVISNPVISRVHCTITYHSETGGYMVCDYSRNGIYRENGQQLPKNKSVWIQTGDILCLGNEENVVQLG
ncbi:MAG: LytTR family transcriptional regulator DNA-binding domain-containing protein [Lachnospiraceae bacterium]|nr:LytTR family transcriptional regulator DNA-binding domain-containing protein [Lachnospiraceae bacterium]